MYHTCTGTLYADPSALIISTIDTVVITLCSGVVSNIVCINSRRGVTPETIYSSGGLIWPNPHSLALSLRKKPGGMCVIDFR